MSERTRRFFLGVMDTGWMIMISNESPFDFIAHFNGQLELANPGLTFAPPRGWIFHRGMLFGATNTWWGEVKERPSPHEGVDFCHYLNAEGMPSTLSPKVRLTTPLRGEVAAVSDDFLGRSVWLRHPEPRGKNTNLYSVYAHIIPTSGIRDGSAVEMGDTIGTIAAGNSSGIVPAHLHVSLFFAPVFLAAELLDWRRLTSLPEVRLIDPLQPF